MPRATRSATPQGLHLTPGQASDLNGADALIDRLLEADAAIADRAYSARERVLEPLARHESEAVIPSKRDHRVQREHDRHLYKARHLIENWFGRLKGSYRAIATRYDKAAAIFLGAIHLAAAIDWLR